MMTYIKDEIDSLFLLKVAIATWNDFFWCNFCCFFVDW